MEPLVQVRLIDFAWSFLEKKTSMQQAKPEHDIAENDRTEVQQLLELLGAQFLLRTLGVSVLLAFKLGLVVTAGIFWRYEMGRQLG